MYQSLFQPRSYKRGPNLSRSYARHINTHSTNLNSFNDNESVEGLAKALAKGCKTRGQVLIEQIIESGKEFEKENRSKTRFAKVLESMRKLKEVRKARGSRNSNPDSEKEDLVEVEQMSRSFHGREPQEVFDVVQDIEYEDRLAILADLIELQVLTSSGKHIRTINFDRDRPRLTCNAEGTNLELVGGDQELGLHSENGKDLVEVGYCVSIAYETDKHHLEGSNGKIEAYEHYFGEEWYKDKGYAGNKFFEKALDDGIVHEASKKGVLPLLVYDCRNERIMFVGGKYKVEDVGIRD